MVEENAIIQINLTMKASSERDFLIIMDYL